MASIVITFGEIMGRLDMPDGTKVIQALPGDLRFSFAGAEASVAASLAYLGQETRYLTALPDNEVGDACVHRLRGLGIDTSAILRIEGRLGIYYVETGANQRPSKVIYDRKHSAISRIDVSAFNQEKVFANTTWLHVSGITPALSAQSAKNTLGICKEAKKRGLSVSCDLNFRKKLWDWGPDRKMLARKTMSEILPYVDVLIANEEDSADVFNLHPANSNVVDGKIAHMAYLDIARQICQQFSNIKKVATTLRESISASHNNWGAMLYDKGVDKAYFAPTTGEGSYQPYPICHIIDRVGGGDSFAAGLIFALNSQEYRHPEKAVAFATAASCLCHSIRGDFNYSTKEEVELLMQGNVSGRVQR